MPFETPETRARPEAAALMRGRPRGDWSVLALDLGGTQIRAAVVRADGTVHAQRRTRTPVEEGGEAIVQACLDMLEGCRDAHIAAGASPSLVGIGIAAPGPVDPVRGQVIDPPNLGRSFHDTPLAARVGARLGLPAFLDRDTQVAALGEGGFGAARGCADYLYLTVSTGIGGAIMSGGKLLRGPDGTAGELGHLLVDPHGPPCGCGAVGHLEAVASGSAIARAARRRIEAGESPSLARLALERGLTFGAREVAEAEMSGDPVAASIMSDARAAFAGACVGLVDVFNPSLIVVGGSLAAGQGDRWLDPARAAVARQAFRVPGRRARIVPAALGADVGLAGAAMLVAERLSVDAGADPTPRSEVEGPTRI
jgi:glucokinase